jgi:hypothetical protein
VFYSSCTGKPSRFQFIYIPNSEKIQTDENRIISNANCQYYIDVANPERDYSQDDNGYWMLNGSSTLSWREEGENGSLVTISNLYKGKRYGFV